MMRYTMVVSDKGHQKKSPFDMIAPFKAYAIERHRNEADIEKRARMIRGAGGEVIAVGLEDDHRFQQRAKLAVLQLTNGSWSVERARSYMMEHLLETCHDAFVMRMNHRGSPAP